MDGNIFKTKREFIEEQFVILDTLIMKSSISEAKNKLGEIICSCNILGEASAGDVQNRAINDFNTQINQYSANILLNRENAIIQNDNIVFKCNWNDKYYQAPCSKEAYNFNIKEGRVWCSSEECMCRNSSEVTTKENYPCYESIALKEMMFGAGWDHTGGNTRPRHITYAHTERVAFLSTRPPGTDEIDRLIIGCIFIDKISEGPNVETILFGDLKMSFAIDHKIIQLKFWDYYSNINAVDSKIWSTGLYRYISNNTVLKMLKDINKQYKKADLDVNKIHSLIEFYEELTN